MALASCSLGRRPPDVPVPGDPISAPAIPAPSPTALQFATPPPAPTGGPCVNDADFVTDTTIPDGMRVEPGAPIDKRWRVRNSGTCDWGAGYALVRVSGPAMGSQDVSGLFPARAAAEIEVQLLLTAPTETGEYTTTWRLRDAEGELFGDALFINIVVAETP